MRCQSALAGGGGAGQGVLPEIDETIPFGLNNGGEAGYEDKPKQRDSFIRPSAPFMECCIEFSACSDAIAAIDGAIG